MTLLMFTIAELLYTLFGASTGFLLILIRCHASPSRHDDVTTGAEFVATSLLWPITLPVLMVCVPVAVMRELCHRPVADGKLSVGEAFPLYDEDIDQ